MCYTEYIDRDGGLAPYMKMENEMSRMDLCKQVFDAEQTVEGLSKACFRSVMQLRRDFYSAAGYSVNEYLRYLRLSNALCKIKNSTMSLADIAYSCGYSSQQALCRDIRFLLNTTATEYRNNNDYYFLSAPRENIPFSIEVKKASVPKTLCLKYYSPSLSGIENKAVTAFLCANPGYTGRIFGRNGIQDGSRFCYALYVDHFADLNTDGFEVDGYFDGYDAVFAQLKVKNNERAINAAWDYLYSDWLPKSMFAYAGAGDRTYKTGYFEEYYYMNARVIRLKLFLPLVRKEKITKITIESSVTMQFLVSTKTGADAEREASREVMSYLLREHPHTVKNIREFFCRKSGNAYTCGVKTDLKISDGEVQVLNYSNRSFAIMQFSGISDYEDASLTLFRWLDENGFSADGEPFALYDTSESYDDPKMKLFYPISTKYVSI